MEALKAILEALRIFHNPDATEREKDIAASKLRDIIESLFGETKTKMTIRKSLIKLQKLNLKEIGEIVLYEMFEYYASKGCTVDKLSEVM